MDFGSISGRSAKSSMKRKQSSSLLTAFRKSSQPPPTSYVPPASSTSSHFPSEPESPYAESTSSNSHSQAFYSDFNPGSSSRYAESTTSTARTATDQGHAYAQYGRGGAGRVRSSSGAVSTGSGGGSEGKQGKEREREREKSGGVMVRRPEDLAKVVKDRLFSWSYMMQWYQGETHWFNTVKIPRTTTESYLGPKALESRARNFFILGISLGLLFDMANATDYLRAVNRVLEEWEGMVEGGGKVRGLFKGQKGTRKFGGGGEYMGMQDGDSALLQVNLPFTLDFFQVHSTTCSLIRDVYKKTLRLFLPSRLPTSAWSPPAPDPLALLHQSTIIHSAPLEAPLPSRTNSSEHAQTVRSPSSRSTSSTSHMAHMPEFSPRAEMDEPELTGIQQAFNTPRGARAMGEGEYDAFQAYILGKLGGDRMLIGEGQAMTKEAVELFMKVDTKLRKHLSSLLRETDILARRVLDEELNALMASLNPGSKPLAFDYTAALSHTGNGFALQQTQGRPGPGSSGVAASPKPGSIGISGRRTSSMGSAGTTHLGAGPTSSSRGKGPRGLGIGIPQSSQARDTPGPAVQYVEVGSGVQIGMEEERGAGWVGPEDISDEQHGR